MLRLFCATSFILAALALASPRHGHADNQKTLSPYFVIESAGANDRSVVESLPLKDTTVDVTVAGVIADVTVRQTYHNTGSVPIHARYVFPASTRAAVHGMRMRVGSDVIEAKIKRREEARKQYNRAKAAGKNASLLEQDRPNVFTTRVSNIMPGSRLIVELRYTELLVPDKGVYSFVYPTVVGPRYAGNAQRDSDGRNDFLSSGYTRGGTPPKSTFRLDGRISSAIPIREVTSPSHPFDVSFLHESLVEFGLDPKVRFGGDRDAILYYRLAGDAIESGLMLHEGEGENFFLLMAEPPKRVAPESIPGREYVFILDVSGSMRGFPLDTAKILLRDLVSGLRETDRFNVILFSGDSKLMAPRSVAATEENIVAALAVIDSQYGGGSTQLLSAMETAMELAHEQNLSRSFVVVTDGYIGTERRLFDYVRAHRGDANVFSFGIGTSVNRFLIEGLARAGQGEPFVVTKPEESLAQAERFQSYIATPALTNIEIDYGEFEAYDVQPLSVPDLLASRPVVVFGKWRGNNSGVLRVRGLSGTGPFLASLDVSQAPIRSDNRALEHLWARSRIADLSDYGHYITEEEKEEVTALGLHYGLLTEFTSFIAVRHTISNPGLDGLPVSQPLPMPDGVADTAIGGGSMQTGSEPGLFALAALLMVLLSCIRIGRQGRNRYDGAS